MSIPALLCAVVNGIEASLEVVDPEATGEDARDVEADNSKADSQSKQR